MLGEGGRKSSEGDRCRGIVRRYSWCPQSTSKGNYVEGRLVPKIQLGFRLRNTANKATIYDRNVHPRTSLRSLLRMCKT